MCRHGIASAGASISSRQLLLPIYACCLRTYADNLHILLVSHVRLGSRRVALNSLKIARRTSAFKQVGMALSIRTTRSEKTESISQEKYCTSQSRGKYARSCHERGYGIFATTPTRAFVSMIYVVVVPSLDRTDRRKDTAYYRIIYPSARSWCYTAFGLNVVHVQEANVG